MFQTVYKAFLIGPNGTQIVDRELYLGTNKDDALKIYNDAVFRLDASWHFFSPRDRVVVSMTGTSGEKLMRTFGE